ncbi:Mu-like prophage major head subunit gpT family protein [Falsiroseomonas sp.]|uniref:Mu-like prophage major head subunit gpT family protein n=1 Tax=Falsiroseomonas sp. TaxID=2870721 RepID=UPI003F6F9FD3
MIINSGNLRSLYTGFSAAFQVGLTGAPSQWRRIAMEVPSTTKANDYGWLKDLPKIREWIGERVLHNLETGDYRLVNKPWELTIGVDKDDIEDDNLGLYTPMFQQIGQNTAEFPDELVFEVAANAFSALCYDGQYFFDTDHPVVDENGVTQSVSNSGGGSGAPWMLLDTSRPMKPFIFQNRRAFDFVRMDAATDEAVFSHKKLRYGVDGRMVGGYGLWQLGYGSKQTLNAASYAAARAAMMGMRGDRGRKLNLRPNLLVVPPSLETAGREVLLRERDAAGATNIWQNTAELMVTPWLA